MARKKKFKIKKDVLNKIIAVLLIFIAGLGFFKFGFLGKIVKMSGIYLFGGLNLLLFGILLLIAIYLLFKEYIKKNYIIKFFAIVLILIGASMLMHIHYFDNSVSYKNALLATQNDINNMISNVSKGSLYNPVGSGYIGFYITYVFNALIDKTGTIVLAYILLTISFLIFAGHYLSLLIKEFKEKYQENKLKRKEEKRLNKEEQEKQKSKVIINDNNAIKEKTVYSNIEEFEKKEDNHEVKKDSEDIVSLLTEGESEKDFLEKKEEINHFYKLPPLDLLKYSPIVKNDSKQHIEGHIKILEKTLREFGIIGHVVEVNQGPAVTQYEMELQTGTKLNRLLSIDKEISLALAKKDVRIQAPIPGKSTVGVEVPNENVSMVSLREILENIPENKKDNKLMVALGKNIMGKSFFAEINKTPHLLVAGSTGSGKSVCINCILASILMRATPQEVKLVLIDPKKVELTMYENIPHLLHPLITESTKANNVLKTMVVEMENRFLELERKKVKNIEAYNELIEEENKNKKLGEKALKMPYIVVVIDELSDLMLVAGKEVEQSILRITQKARAAGIHLIVATQRPSTDVITGIIKANIPSRLSFTVASGIDSRTILDMTGAEKLLGRGDMLYLPIGQSTPDRVQGAFVSDSELEKITNFVNKQQKQIFNESFLKNVDNSSEKSDMSNVGKSEADKDDTIYNDCLEYVVREGKASTSLLQRRFRLGYNRAANIIDLLEERGVIGPQNGSKPREVLIAFSDQEEK